MSFKRTPFFLCFFFAATASCVDAAAPVVADSGADAWPMEDAANEPLRPLLDAGDSGRDSAQGPEPSDAAEDGRVATDAEAAIDAPTAADGGDGGDGGDAGTTGSTVVAQCYSNATAGSINVRVDYLGDGSCRCFATSCNGVDARCARPGTPAYAAAGTGPRIPLPDEEAFLGTAPNLRVTDFSDPANRLTEVYVFGRRILRVGREPGVTTQRRRTEDLAAGGLVGKYLGCTFSP